MTREEAIASLKALCHTCKFFPTCVNDKPECFRAIEMAIKSLKAWGKIHKEIDDSILICQKDAQNNNWCDGELTGFLQCKDIIDRHLSEVNE
jgi:hypothetical protein